MTDVCLVVEGSYPYVTGGVSVWAHGLIEGLPEVSFTVAHVCEAGEPEPPHAFALPGNARLFRVDSEQALPEARVYHAACTGAAGELARRAAADQGAAFVLTEHGLAWREARWGIEGCKHGFVDIRGCKHGFVDIRGCKHGFVDIRGCKHGYAEPRPLTRAEALQRAEDVLAMARDAYASADAITSVCGPNALAQHALGAPRERLHVIPNAVAEGPRREEHDGLVVGFVGRVVAVKDVATFLRACARIAAERPDARFVVAGPMQHEPEYARAMEDLAAELELGDRVTFTGETDPRPWLARLDALVLTSLSEAQPLVALEAMAAGVPVVATDVGGCREALGGAGLLTAPRDPRATAAAVLRIAGDELLRARLAAAGRRRAATTHATQRVLGAYHELYERLAA